jgi:hypothetical protein
MRIINDSQRSGSSRTKTRSLTQRERLSYGIERLMRDDIGMTRTQAIGALGSMAGESGAGFKTDAYNPNDPNGGSFGIAQWHSDRRWGLEAHAKNSKYGLKDFRTQMDYVAEELKTTHKHVLNSMKKATTLKEATKTWTSKFEVPDPKKAHHDRRYALAKQFAGITQKGPKSPQEAADAANGALGGLAAGVGSLTGATNVESAYAEEGEDAIGDVNTGYAEEGTSVTRQLERQAQQGVQGGFFEQMFTGVSGAIAGATEDLSQKANHVSNTIGLGDVVDGKQVESGGTSLDDTGDKMNPSPNKDDGFFGDANMGGMGGALLGGYFAGPVGALIGGLAGQGIARSLSKISDMRQKDADDAETAGMAGGIGRALDGLFGGFGIFNKRDPVDSMGPDDYPDAPKGGKNSGQSGKGFSYSDLSSEGRQMYNDSQQVRDAVDSGKEGLW